MSKENGHNEHPVVVIAHICRCGHAKDYHAPLVFHEVADPGHGKCEVPNCNCKQFTWVKAITVG